MRSRNPLKSKLVHKLSAGTCSCSGQSVNLVCASCLKVSLSKVVHVYFSEVKGKGEADFMMALAFVSTSDIKVDVGQNTWTTPEYWQAWLHLVQFTCLSE